MRTIRGIAVGIFCLMMLVPVSSSAEDVPILPVTCKAIDDFAGSVMKVRQAGIPMVKVW